MKCEAIYISPKHSFPVVSLELACPFSAVKLYLALLYLISPTEDLMFFISEAILCLSFMVLVT